MIVPTLETEADNTADVIKPSLKTANDRFQSVGELLQIARNHHKLSIADVAKKLYLVEDKIIAMEAEQWASLGAQIYARGYVDTYARLVGMPKDVWQPLLSKIDFFKPDAITGPITRKPITIDDKRRAFFRNQNGGVKKTASGLSKLLVSGVAIFVVVLAILFWIGEHNKNSGFTQDVSKPMQLQLSNLDQDLGAPKTTPVKEATYG